MGRRAWIGIVVVAVVVAGGVVLAGLALGGGNDPSSTQDYQASVVQARDRVDFALGRLSKAQSVEELLTRMDEAAAAVGDAGAALDEETPPDAVAEAHGQLVADIEELSVDVQSTADQAREPGFEEILFSGAGLNFESWDKINAVLAEMKAKGVVVQPLSRHTTS